MENICLKRNFQHIILFLKIILLPVSLFYMLINVLEMNIKV